MITSKHDLHRFTPEENGPTYLIRTPTYRDRAAWHRAIMALGGRQVTRDSLMATLRMGIPEVFDGEEATRWLEFCDEYMAATEEVQRLALPVREYIRAREARMASEAAGSATDAQVGEDAVDAQQDDPDAVAAAEALLEAQRALDKLRPFMLHLEDEVRLGFRPYAIQLADQLYWLQIAPRLACQMFLVGVEGGDVEIVRKKDMVPDSVLDRLPEGHAIAIGWEAVEILTGTGRHTKN